MKKMILFMQTLLVFAAVQGGSDPVAVFTNIYNKNGWRVKETASGIGSTMRFTVTIRRKLPQLLKQLKVTSLLDAPCGDFYWMKNVKLAKCKYIGVDIVKQIINNNNKRYSSPGRTFLRLNAIKDDLPQVDLILCRDLLAHLPYKDVFSTLANFKKSKAKYLLATTWRGWPNTPHNTNIAMGLWRPLDLEKPPFSLPKPILLIKEDEPHKYLGLWLLDSITVDKNDSKR